MASGFETRNWRSQCHPHRKVMERIELFEGVLAKGQNHQRTDPNRLWNVLVEQVTYLIDLEKGRAHDTCNLNRLSIGTIAAHEVDEKGHGLALRLSRVGEEVDEMRRERQVK